MLAEIPRTDRYCANAARREYGQAAFVAIVDAVLSLVCLESAIRAREIQLRIPIANTPQHPTVRNSVLSRYGVRRRESGSFFCSVPNGLRRRKLTTDHGFR